jgi:branched-chain amino acid transport system permease protein
VVNLDALLNCVSASSCLVTQISAGLIIGMLLFLVACGLTLIFGVLGVINFTHGSFYMMGAYIALTTFQTTGSYTAAVLASAMGVALFGVIFERFFMARVYGGDVLMQLLVCYAFILILDDVTKIIWGPDFRSMGMPEAFVLPPLRVAGGFLPPFYLFLTAVTVAIAITLGVVVAKTRFGKTVRAAAANRQMVGVLGVNTTLLYAAIFALGSALAGIAGALAAPVRSVVPGMGFSILIESFIVTVIGGMGSIAGAFVASILVGVTRSFGSIGFPLFTDGVMFVFMALVLLIKPTGLFGRKPS